MGLPLEGRVRSVPAAAGLLGVSEATVIEDATTNIDGAAAILRDLAQPGLRASGPRDTWLEAVAAYFDAGAAGQALALDVRRAAARGVVAEDGEGDSILIPSFATLYPERAPASLRQALPAEYPGATWVAAHSSNYTNASRRSADIDYVVIHTVQGSYAGAISWFQNSQSNVSAHYVVRRSDGAITQMLKNEDMGWHAGVRTYNQRSIGIEHEGWVSDSNNYTQAMLQASADLTRWLCDTLGIPKDRQHIVGHSEIPGATHGDPGRYFPWSQYMNLVNSSGGAPPPAGTGTLKGVVFADGDTSRRVGGASVTVNPGGQTTTARASDGYWSFSLAPGTYTVTAMAAGYSNGQSTRAVTAGQEAWGSIDVTRASTAGTGELKGVVYDARASNLDTRIPGATVRASNGAMVTADGDGAFVLELAPGAYTFTASHPGWREASVTRTVVARDVEWGSIGLLPDGAPPMNTPPSVPALDTPRSGVETRGAAPLFAVSGLDDADGDALTIDVQVHSEGAVLSEGVVRVDAGATQAAWIHPRADLPRGATVTWRARASDGAASSPWSAEATFIVGADGTAMVAGAAWTIDALQGAGTNSAPTAPEIIVPIDGAAIDTTRPRIAARAASDAEADPLVHELQVATDDLFEQLEASSGLLLGVDAVAGGPTWVVTTDLAPGSTYFVRARAADEQVFGPWSPAVSFTIASNASVPDDAHPRMGPDTGGTPDVALRATPDELGGCSATHGAGGGATWLLLFFGLALRRAAT